MKTSKSSNLLVGSTVLFDYPIYAVREDLPEPIKKLNADEAKKRPYYGQTGVIMVAAMVEGAVEMTVRLDTTGELVKAFTSFVSVTKLPAPDRTEALLEEILAAIKNLPQSPVYGTGPR